MLKVCVHSPSVQTLLSMRGWWKSNNKPIFCFLCCRLVLPLFFFFFPLPSSSSYLWVALDLLYVRVIYLKPKLFAVPGANSQSIARRWAPAAPVTVGAPRAIISASNMRGVSGIPWWLTTSAFDNTTVAEMPCDWLALLSRPKTTYRSPR